MWWFCMMLYGFVLGAFAAWTQGGLRVFMKTLGMPLALLLAHILFHRDAPAGPFAVLADLFILAGAGFCADYLVGLKLGRHGRDGMRGDSVGH